MVKKSMNQSRFFTQVLKNKVLKSSFDSHQKLTLRIHLIGLGPSFSQKKGNNSTSIDNAHLILFFSILCLLFLDFLHDFPYFVENNNDLFAKAPFGSESNTNDSKITALTQGLYSM